MSEFDLNAELGLGNVLGNVNANVPAQAPVQPQNDFSELLSGTLFGAKEKNTFRILFGGSQSSLWENRTAETGLLVIFPFLTSRASSLNIPDLLLSVATLM